MEVSDRETQFRYEHTLGLRRKHKHNPYPYPSGILRQRYPFFLPYKRPQITLFTNNNSSSCKRRRFTRFHHLYNKNDDELSHCKILQSCNGLLLWKTNQVTRKELLQPRSFYVSNPTTGHYVAIDQFGHQFRTTISKPVLVFEPWKSPHYRIIFFSKVGWDGNKLKMKMSVYSSATGSWSKLDLLPSFPDKIDYHCDGVYCNGAIHWYAIGKNSVHFDIDSLCLKTLPALQLPALPSLELEVVYFGGCGGNLHLIVGKIDENLRYDIWELKEDYSGWIVRYYIDLRTIKSYGLGHVDVSCVVRQPPKEDEDEESMLAILVVDLNKFVAYNLKDHSSRIFYERGERYVPYFHPPYFETLAAVTGYRDIIE